MDKSVRFWDRIAERYARNSIANPDAYQKKIDLTQQYLNPESRVLEFGCGTGSTALIHATKVQHIVAIDYSPKMIDIANRKLAEAPVENVTFSCTSLFDPEYEEESFDAVLALNVLHLIDNYQTFIQRAYDLLKPGGVFVSSTAVLGKSRLLKLVLKPGSALGLIPKIQFIAQDQLENELTECGFTLKEKLSPSSRFGAVFIIGKKS
jgi:2-polyprenyl-3-methyl-5-hydroxy-6-metoxy-1,4-benzoquinol methylase